MNNKTRTLFYGIIGAYLVYLSYDLFPARNGQMGEGTGLMLACCILFAIAGAVCLILAIRLFKKAFIEGEEENREE